MSKQEDHKILASINMGFSGGRKKGHVLSMIEQGQPVWDDVAFVMLSPIE